MTNSGISPWFALVGVCLGFLLGEGSRYLRYRLEIFRNKRLVRAELQSVLAQLPFKRDILAQAVKHMNGQRFLPMVATATVTSGYLPIQQALYPHLKPVERNCLHIIFERLRVLDEQMAGMEDAFMRAIKDKVVTDPWVIYSGRCEELLASCGVVAELAQSYLEGNAIDVYPPGRDG